MGKVIIKSPKTLIIAFTIVIMLFMVPLENKIGGIWGTFIKNIDELFSIFFFGLILIQPSKKTDFFISRVSLFYFLFILWGILCSFLFTKQSLTPIVKDIISCSKFLLTFLGVHQYMLRKRSWKPMKTYLYLFSKISILLLFVYCLYSWVTSNSLTSVSILGSHSVNSSHIAVGLMAILIYSNGIKRNYVWLFLASIICASSMTAKSFGIVLLLYALVFFKSWLYGLKKWILYIFVAIGIFLVAYDSFVTFYFNTKSARSLLLLNGIKIAVSKKIFGFGFAMYGSSQAAESYSPLYSNLGFNNRYGMMASDSSYLTDSFWPTVIGQFGFLGLILFTLFITFMIRYIYSFRKINYSCFTSSLLIFSYLIIMSSSSSAFFNPIAVPYAALLGIIMAEYTGCT